MVPSTMRRSACTGVIVRGDAWNHRISAKFVRANWPGFGAQEFFMDILDRESRTGKIRHVPTLMAMIEQCAGHSKIHEPLEYHLAPLHERLPHRIASFHHACCANDRSLCAYRNH